MTQSPPSPADEEGRRRETHQPNRGKAEGQTAHKGEHATASTEAARHWRRRWARAVLKHHQHSSVRRIQSTLEEAPTAGEPPVKPVVPHPLRSRGRALPETVARLVVELGKAVKAHTRSLVFRSDESAQRTIIQHQKHVRSLEERGAEAETLTGEMTRRAEALERTLEECTMLLQAAAEGAEEVQSQNEALRAENERWRSTVDALGNSASTLRRVVAAETERAIHAEARAQAAEAKLDRLTAAT